MPENPDKPKKRHPAKPTALQRLVAEGFFDTPSAALPYLLSGDVFCGTERVRTGGQRIPPHLPLTVRGLSRRYVSKGGYKLEGAIRDFHIDVRNRICIDAGACTGGFTDCLIQHGAERVYAVEAGFGQLMGSLRQNPRVVNLERTNLGDEKLLLLEPMPTLGTVDLSYLSLVKAVPQFRTVLYGHGELVCLVKPLFETESANARRTGNITPEDYAPLLIRLIDALSAQKGTEVCGLTHSHVTGNHGTHEFFLHVRFTGNTTSTDEAAIQTGITGQAHQTNQTGQTCQISTNWNITAQEAVRQALALPLYEK